MTVYKKTDNHDPSAKLELRRWFMARYHSDGRARVVDCCMGAGLLWSRLREEFGAESYLGLDVKSRKGRLKIDSARYLAAGGWKHDVIDVDTYGSPWGHWMEILRNGQGKVTVFLTYGFLCRDGFGGISKEVITAIGITGLHVPPSMGSRLEPMTVTYCLGRLYGMGWRLIEAKEAEHHGSARYIGLRIEKQEP